MIDILIIHGFLPVKAKMSWKLYSTSRLKESLPLCQSEYWNTAAALVLPGPSATLEARGAGA